MDSAILFERTGAVARITLNRPHCGNALDLAMTRELLEAIKAAEEDERIRALVLTGAGKLFCAGGDVAAFSDAGAGLPEFLREITVCLHTAIMHIVRMPKPVIIAINGPVAGAGVGLALCGDITIADPAAHFTLAYTGLGLTPDGGVTWLLPRLVGLRRAQQLCLTNKRMKAEEAVALGLVTSLAAAGELAAETAVLAEELAMGATAAIGATKRLLLASWATSLDMQLEAESLSISERGRSAEGKEGIASFMEKRSPNFTNGGLRG